MASVLDLFRQKARPVRSLLNDPSRHVVKMFASGSRKSVSYGEMMNAQNAMRHPVVFRCIHKISLAVQDVPWYVMQDPDENAPKVDKKVLKAIQEVLNHPNDTMSASQFRYWLGMNKAVFNRFAIKVGAKTTGGPNAIYPLSQGHFKTKFKRNGTVDRYLYGPKDEENLPPRREVDGGFDGNFKKSFAYEYVTPGVEGVLDVKTFEVAKNNSPLNAISYPSTIVQLLLQRAYDTASGEPNIKYIISGEKTLTSEQEDELEAEISDRKTGSEESGDILFIGNTSIKIDKLDSGLSDIHTKIPMDDMSRIIYSNWGIPVALAGIGSSDAAKFAGNYEASRRSFFEDTIIPNYLGPIADGMTEALCPAGAKIMFDLDAIPGLADARANKAKSLQGVTFLSDAEKRILCGFPPSPERYQNAQGQITSEEGTSSEKPEPETSSGKRR